MLEIFDNETCSGSGFTGTLNEATEFCSNTRKPLCIPKKLYDIYCDGNELKYCKDIFLAKDSSSSLFGCGTLVLLLLVINIDE